MTRSRGVAGFFARGRRWRRHIRYHQHGHQAANVEFCPVSAKTELWLSTTWLRVSLNCRPRPALQQRCRGFCCQHVIRRAPIFRCAWRSQNDSSHQRVLSTLKTGPATAAQPAADVWSIHELLKNRAYTVLAQVAGAFLYGRMSRMSIPLRRFL
jgi:hypothetical protein